MQAHKPQQMCHTRTVMDINWRDMMLISSSTHLTHLSHLIGSYSLRGLSLSFTRVKDKLEISDYIKCFCATLTLGQPWLFDFDLLDKVCFWEAKFGGTEIKEF